MPVLFAACQLSGYSSFLHVDFWLCNLCNRLNREKILEVLRYNQCNCIYGLYVCRYFQSKLRLLQK